MSELMTLFTLRTSFLHVKVNPSLQIKSHSVFNTKNQRWVVIIHELKVLRTETGPKTTIKIIVNVVVLDFSYILAS